MSRATPNLLALCLLAACAHPAAVTCPTPPTVAAVAPPAPVATPAVAPTPAPAPAPADVASGYDQPPKDVLDVLRAPSPPSPYLAPTHDTILLVSWVDYPSI